MATRTDLRRRARTLVALAALMTVGLAGCRKEEQPAEASSGNWSVTAWGKLFEVFPEVEPLVAGQKAVAHTHVTRLSDFSPLVEGDVEIVLAGGSGEQVFGAKSPVRPGIYQIEIEPRTAGSYDLLFRIRSAKGRRMTLRRRRTVSSAHSAQIPRSRARTQSRR